MRAHNSITDIRGETISVSRGPANRVLEVSAAGYSGAKNSLLPIHATTPPSVAGYFRVIKTEHSQLYRSTFSY